MDIDIKILGCGSSTGVPIVGNYWGACNPANPKNIRTRPALYIESPKSKILIDAGPDLRQQLLEAQVTWLDAVLFTHTHADHTHGIDDLRAMNWARGDMLPLYAEQPFLDDLINRFSYCFCSKAPRAKARPSFAPNLIEPYKKFQIDDLEILPFEQSHGFSQSTGFRIGNFAYSTDVVAFPDRSWDALQGIETWIVDCNGYDPNPVHAHLDLTLEWIEKLGVKQAYLTHMSPKLDYDELCKKLPMHVKPAFDGIHVCATV